ncbi:hypothetical protein Poly51_03280 [Rubripirellula tenax]|uniref:GYF domain-containing protein n=1 Tax=Rubripirellula tenax TaxID=2528015 RepID=A0A5C6FJX0_9BACT|nr:hypothetical protein [Rubripirellula tenax]TWU60054.1 hypothetical protein Poly51_03280 [Rubripirellula tenax]
MSFQIDDDTMYRIRSRGVERPAVAGHRLGQMVRDFVLARHDELSEDGLVWFSAGDVDSLFPRIGQANLVRQRQVFDAHEIAGATTSVVEPEIEMRRFSREPWYVARGSNVAGPYDQVTIVGWYNEGRLFDKDQLRPGLNASWRSMADARSEGLLAPPAANSIAAHANHLIAEPPVWLGPAQEVTSAAEFTPELSINRGGDGAAPLRVLIFMAVLGGVAMLVAAISGLIYFFMVAK